MSLLSRVASRGSVKPLDMVEFLTSLDRHIYIENYFIVAPSKNIERVQLTLQGRNITVFGISEEESIEEFNKAFDEMIIPVVRNVELAEVIDRFLADEVRRKFAELSPLTPGRGLGWTYRDSGLSEDEDVLIVREMAHFESRRPTQEELRASVDRLPTAKLKRIFLSYAEPLTTPDELEWGRTMLKVRRLSSSVIPFIDPMVKPLELRTALATLPEQYREHFQGALNLLERRIQAFETFIGEYTALHTMVFVLGEEMHKRLLKILPIQWMLPKENLPKFREQIEYHLMGMRMTGEAAAGPSENVVLVSRGEVDDARELLDKFRENKDYILADEFFPRILPYINRPLHPSPRIERVKQVFRSYFPIERLLKGVTGEMVQYFEGIPPSIRERLGGALQRKKTSEEKLTILSRARLPEFRGSIEEKEILADFLTLFVPKENDLFFALVPPDEDPYGTKEVTPEMYRYYEYIRNRLLPEERERLVEKMEEEAPTIDEKIRLLREFHLPEPDMPRKKQAILLNFLPLLLEGPIREAPLEPLIPSVGDQLAILEQNARMGLESSIRDIGLQVSFMQEGREITLGSRPISPEEIGAIMRQMIADGREDEVPDSFWEKAVLVDPAESEGELL